VLLVSTFQDLAQEFAKLVALELYKLQNQPTKGEESGPLVTTLEAANRLGCHPDTMRDWAKSGCPHDRIGNGRIRWNLSAVRTWLANRE